MKVLITGGAGFIGSNFVRHILNSRRDVNVINFDSLTYAGNPESLADIAENPRYQFIRGDITDRQAVDAVFKDGLDALVNFAAETHVDRSIEDATPFLRTNILGTQCLLDAAKRCAIFQGVMRELSVELRLGAVPGKADLNFFYIERRCCRICHNLRSKLQSSRRAIGKLHIELGRTARCHHQFQPKRIGFR